MKHLIDKDVLAAHIKKLKMDIGPIFNEYDEGFSEGRSTAFNDVICALDIAEVKEVDLEKEKEKLNKAIKLADAMYDAAQLLTTDASKLHKAMQDWWNFKNINL